MGAVHIDYKTISWGGPNEDDSNDVWQVETGANDPGEITLEDVGTVGTPIQNFPAPDTYSFGGKDYQRVFWNVADGIDVVPGYPSTGKFLNVPNLAGVFSATAWYVLPGSGPGTPGLRARSFDIDLNNFRKETPIHAAKPAEAWPGPNNHSISTQSDDVVAVAKGSLLYPAPFQNQPPGEPAKYFKQWLSVFGSLKIDPPPGPNVGCAAKTGGLVLAFFGHSPPVHIGKPSLPLSYDYWAEFWGKRGAEGVGPWGPHGPSGPWGPLTQRWFESLGPDQQQVAVGMLTAKIAAGKLMP
jgi:hypothetical protein